MTDNPEAALASQNLFAGSTLAQGIAAHPARAVSANFLLAGDEAVAENPP